MIKLLHSADWHLDAPLRGLEPEQRAFLRREMLALPGKIADKALGEGCDLMLLSGDLFDTLDYTPESAEAVRHALARFGKPVFVAPGNHDYICGKSPWVREKWPNNVHIFTENKITGQTLPELDVKVWGGAFRGMDCPGLMQGFRAQGEEEYQVAVLHGDPTGGESAYCPVTPGQVKGSGLNYLALGHIHAPGRLGGGAGICAWPGCPMGRGYDETGIKGVLVVELGKETAIRFLPMDTPRFYDLEVRAGETPAENIREALDGKGWEDFLRVRLVGEHPGPDLEKLRKNLGEYPNLTLLDETSPAADPWGKEGEDNLEGIYFSLLRQQMDRSGEKEREALELAAKISRMILDGREVELP